MELYLLTQDVVNGYDTYDSVVVAAESEDDARTIHPRCGHLVTHIKDGKWMGTYAITAGEKAGMEYEFHNYEWVDFSERHLVRVTHIGTATNGIERGVILASYNAG